MSKFLTITAKAGLCAALLASAGCSYLFGDGGPFRDKSEDYKQARETPQIRVPEGREAGGMEEIYPIPPVNEELVLAGEFEVPRPTPLVAGAADEVVRIQSLGDNSWALIAIPPGQLWPQVRGFLSAAGIQVGRMDARAGIMESIWVELEGQPVPSRFRYRIEQGVQRGTSELHVKQMNQRGAAPADNAWPEVSDNVPQEREMLKAVAQYIANSADSAPVSMIADQAMSASGKIALQESPEGYTYIHVGLPFDRAWASLAKALEDSSFEITDRDRSAGTYYVTFLGPQGEEEDGWFDWLFGDEEHPLAGQPFEVRVAQDGDNAVNIRLVPQGDADAYDKRQEQALLAILKGNIS
ncbi:outer membrane protein assembly factor BamC [Parahaliea mediterranea]|uniref:outer membrane protein assembly factor BamC n=1 Tax=Parahaliea mediterranea TaxID=651086 RepID=UPI000E2F10F2|nr:outer membrane protein assembly factor BamC [Parahaliea mediterranea]